MQVCSLLNYSISSIKMKRYLPIQIVSFKQAGKKADSLKQELLMACDALEDVCIDNNHDFGEEFLESLIEFSRAAASNDDAHKKVKDPY